MFKKSVILLFALALVFALGLTGCAPDDPDEVEKVELTANSVWPPGNHHSEGLVEFAQRVEEATDGRVSMEVHTGGALGYDGPELPTVVRDGLVDVSDYVLGGAAGEEPAFGLFTLPFLIDSMEEGRILQDTSRPYFDELMETKWNQKILYTAPWPMAGFFTQWEINELEDLDGIQMRAYDRMGAAVVEAAGGTPYPLPFAEVYGALQTGTIDSVLTSTPTGVDAAFWEVLDYFHPIGVTMSQNYVTMNLDKFNELDEETQDILLSVGQEMEERMWEEIGPDLDAESEAKLNEMGIETIEPSDELMNDLYELTEDIRQDWLEDEAPDMAIAIVEEFNEKVGR